MVDIVDTVAPPPPPSQLSRNYSKALERVSRELEFFPKHLQHRSKQRLTKIHQYLIRMRKLKLKAKPKLVTVNPKVCLRYDAMNFLAGTVSAPPRIAPHETVNPCSRGLNATRKGS